ncbi:MAG: haloacid dehalogenase-like hydrolase [Planctomycetaceae bacterium]
MHTVCLFDIDGTLLNSGGAGQLAMERALANVCGLTEINGDIPAAGRTDRAITTDLFRLHAIDDTPELWRTFQEEYFRQLPAALNELDGCVLPGIVALLDHLATHSHLTLGLLTGNFRIGAELKLRHYQLEHHFAFGGFGDDHHHRDDVARLAFAAAARHLASEPRADRVWVIGDTPADVTCARAIGAQAVAVATGIYSHDTLAATAPDLLFHDFSDASPLLDRLLSA